MKTTFYLAEKFVKAILIFVLLFSFNVKAQDNEDPGISVHQYRYVPQDQMAEFIARETKYWSKVAEKGVAQGNLTF